MNKMMNSTALLAISITVVVVGVLFAVAVHKQHLGGTRAPSENDFDTLQSMVGKAAPDFTLSNYQGASVKLSALKGKNVILFFNEGLMCYPACWSQMAELGKDPRLNTTDTVSMSVIVDEPGAWKQAVDQMPDLARGEVLFDTTRKVSRDYHTLFLPSSMHAGSMPGHTYVMIDKGGIIRFVKDDPGMGIHNDELVAKLTTI